MDIFQTRRERLKEMVDQVTQGNISVFAKRFDYSRAQISQYLSDSYNEGRSIGERAARTLEKKVGIHTGWLDEQGTPDKSAQAKSLPQVQTALSTPYMGENARNIRVNFTVHPVPDAQGFVELTFVPESEDHGVIRFYPASQAAYGMIVRGSGLRPRVKSGEFLIVDPAIEAAPGDDVFLKLAPKIAAVGPQLIMQLLYKRGEEVVFGHLNESGPTMTVLAAEILSMQPITGILCVSGYFLTK